MLKEYTQELDGLIVAHCRDFDRRDRLISEGRCERRTLMELRFLNYKILDAASDIVGERLAPLFIKDIGSRTGYSSSDVDCMSEGMYKQKKQLCKLSIARRLYLID